MIELQSNIARSGRAAKIEQAEQLLSGATPVLWKNGDEIQWSEVNRLAAFDTSRVLKFFESSERTVKGSKLKDRTPIRFTVKECACKHCRPHDEIISKANLSAIIAELRRNSDFRCPSCERQKEAQEQAERDREEREFQHSDRAECDRFVQWATSEFDPQRPELVTIYDIRYAFTYFNSDHKMVGALREMPYRLFLRTNYWKSIANDIKRKAGNRCQMCNRGGEVHTHHRTYENHGKEHRHPEDLVCVCDACHSKFHGKEARPK